MLHRYAILALLIAASSVALAQGPKRDGKRAAEKDEKQLFADRDNNKPIQRDHETVENCCRLPITSMYAARERWRIDFVTLPQRGCLVKTTRRGFLAATGAAAAEGNVHGQDEGHGHDHQVVPSDPTLRVKALESLLVEKGLLDRAALDALIDTYEHKVGPRNGARVVA